MTETMLRIENLSKSFTQGSKLPFGKPPTAVRAVDGVSFDVKEGETLAVVGESGCGKSTLGRLLLRLIDATEGHVFMGDVDLMALSRDEMRMMRRELQIVFQDPYGSLSPRRTVGDIIAEPLEIFGLVTSRQQARERAGELLEQVGLSATHLDRLPRQFSGGQRQRIGIARAIALNPKFIVADEPVSALDMSIQAQIVNLLQDLQRDKGFSYLFIAHDLAVVRHIADRVMVMYLGRIVEMGPKTAVYTAPHHPYTQALLSAAPEPDPDAAQSRIILKGDVPSPTRIPAGCNFHTRCPIVQDICRQQRPPLREIGPGHTAACHFSRPNPIPV